MKEIVNNNMEFQQYTGKLSKDFQSLDEVIGNIKSIQKQ